MTDIQRRVILSLSVLSLLIGIAWQLHDPGFEPWLFVLSGFIGLITQWWPTRGKRYEIQRLSGSVEFNYSNNNGCYTIGREELLFETAWSKANDTSIHIYNDPPSIDSLAIAIGIAKISDVRGINGLDFSSRSRIAQEGDVVVLKNKFGNFAALKVGGIEDSTRSDSVDQVTFQYMINPGGGSDFK
jgi:hypothetical protein